MSEGQGLKRTGTSDLADVLERVLDTGIVIAGDIRVKLVDIELLTIQVRLVITSVDKAREIGMDWWVRGFNRDLGGARDPKAELAELKRRIAELERVEPPAEIVGAARPEPAAPTLLPGGPATENKDPGPQG